MRYGEDQLPERPLAVILLALLASQGHRVVRSKDEKSVFGIPGESGNVKSGGES